MDVIFEMFKILGTPKENNPITKLPLYQKRFPKLEGQLDKRLSDLKNEERILIKR